MMNKNSTHGENFTNSYESKISSTYAKFAYDKKNQRWDNWGIARLHGRRVNFYTDPKFIYDQYTKRLLDYLQNNQNVSKSKIVDFGGGDGILLDTIIRQLTTAGFSPDNFEFINIDRNKDSLEFMNSELEHDIGAIHADILNESVEPQSTDIGLSRYVLNYFNQIDQEKYLKQINDALKGNGLSIILWPGGDSPEKAEIQTDIYAKITSIIMGDEKSIEEIKQNKFFSSLETVRSMAKKTGFDICESGDIGTHIKISARSVADRFSISNAQKKEINDFIEKISDIYDANKVETGSKNGVHYYVATSHKYLVLTKA